MSSSAPLLTGKWSDAEKVAFLVSIIRNNGSGAPKWADVAVPAGRSMQASQKMYAELLKAAAAVPMTGGPDGPAITPSRKIPRGGEKSTVKGEGDAAATPTKKRGRKPKGVSKETVNDAEADDDEEGPSKKMKTEVKTEEDVADNGHRDAHFDDAWIA